MSYFPEGSEVRRHVFDSFETDQMTGSAGWKNVIGLLKSHYKKDESSSAFETWKEFRNLSRKADQTVDDYIMLYEKYKVKMMRFNMDLGDRIHGLNLLCGANLSDDDLKIAMREIDYLKPNKIYADAKKSLKKYFGKSAITNSPSSQSNTLPIATMKSKIEQSYFSSIEEYESFVAWKQYRRGEKK